MQADMMVDEVIARIRELQQKGVTLNKKSVKKSDPHLMKNALYYFPSWEHALEQSTEG